MKVSDIVPAEYDPYSMIACPREARRGTSPAEAKQRVKKLRSILRVIDPLSTKWKSADIKFVRPSNNQACGYPEYHDLVERLRANETTARMIEKCKDTQQIENDLYFISGLQNEDTKNIFLTLREAFDGEVPVDRTTPYNTSDGEYLVLNEEEARDRTEDYIKDSLWAFKSEFLIDYTDLPEAAESMLRSFQQDKCEDANETLLKLVGGKLQSLVNAAIASDGMGHFLAGYDHEVSRVGPWLIYRTN